MSAAHGGQVLLSQAVVDGVRDGLPAAGVAARSRSRPAAGPFDAGTRLPGRASAAAAGVSGAAFAGDHAEQPAAAAHDLHRARQGAGGVEAALRQGAPADAHRLRRLRQDPPRPAGRRRFARALPRRRVVGGARAARPTRASCRGRWRRCSALEEEPGKPIIDDARRASQGQARSCCCSTTASTCSTRARSWPTRSCARVPAPHDPREQPRSARHRRRADLSRAVAVAARSRSRRRRRRRSRRSRRCSSSSIAALLASARTFGSPPENAATLVSICHRLDGIPLAIELAAARVRSLSVEEINRRLDHRFRLLTGGLAHGAAAPADAALADRLELRPACAIRRRLLLQRLSVFAGGWTLEAAERVCAGDDVERGRGARSS